MKKLLSILLFASLLVLAACGGSGDSEQASEPSDSSSSENTTETTIEEVDAPIEEAEEEAEEEMEETTEEASSEETEESEAVESGEASEESSSGFGDLPMSGTDPDTGLEINPDTVSAGDTYIVRGIVISMNLTPITSPEFLIESPAGVKYRIRTQSLDETFFVDGSQWKPFEYKLGVGGMATVTLDSSASLSDVAVSDDLTLVKIDD